MQQVSGVQADVKVCQLNIAKIPPPQIVQPRINKGDTFSENLVKQLLRQGEDRKTSIEETKIIQSKL